MWPSSARIRGPSGVRSAVLWLSAAPALPARPGYGSVSAENSAPRGATSSTWPPPRRRSHLVWSIRQGKAPRRGQRRLHAATRPCPTRGTCPRKPGRQGRWAHFAMTWPTVWAARSPVFTGTAVLRPIGRLAPRRSIVCCPRNTRPAPQLCPPETLQAVAGTPPVPAYCPSSRSSTQYPCLLP